MLYQLCTIIILFIFLASSIIHRSQCAKILFLPAPAASSHKKSMLPLAAELGKRGHNVTIFMPMIRQGGADAVSLHNVHAMDPLYDTDDQLIMDFLVHKNRTDLVNFWETPPMLSYHVLIPWTLTCYLTSETVVKLNSTLHDLANQKWDLVVVDAFFTPWAYGLVQTSGASFIQQSTTVLYPHNKRNAAIPKPINTHMVNRVDYNVIKFWHRAHAVLFNDIVDPVCEFIINVMINYVLGSEWLPHGRISLATFEPNADVVFDMSPHSIAIAMPRTPAQFMIGDAPCATPESRLPPDYEAFVDDPSSKGTVIAAFGHMISWSIAPAYLKKAFEGAFRKLVDDGFRVVWQYDGSPIDNLPLGIITVRWLPQIELLNHSKTKLFISHCGLKSIMEGICSRCPILAFPVFAEQHYNAQLLTFHFNGGDSLDKFGTTETTLYDKIMSIINNYEEHHDELGRIRSMMEDKIMLDMEVAAFWTEFSIRHTDQMHLLKLRGTKFCFFSYFCLDIIGIVLGCSALFGYAMQSTCTMMIDAIRT